MRVEREVIIENLVDVPVERIVDVPVERVVDVHVEREVVVERLVDVPVERIVDVPVEREVIVHREFFVDNEVIVEVPVIRDVFVEREFIVNREVIIEKPIIEREIIVTEKIRGGRARGGDPELEGGTSAGSRTVVGEASMKIDDLILIEGIGPKINELLQNLGIRTFAELATTSPDRIRQILADGGSRFKMHDPETWPAQAKLAADGRWAELYKWQEELNAGKK